MAHQPGVGASSVQVIFDAVLDVGEASLLHVGVRMGLGHALPEEFEPCEAPADIGEMAVGRMGVERKQLLEVGEGGFELGV